MASDYDRIREDNIRRRGTDFDDIGRFVAEQLYSDRTHFIYELLQNAEDVEAKQVIFRLYPDRLEFRHYGGRPFDTRDVEAISDILRGTKQDDQMKIGKFGIGFKSVFAFTATPEIHSGDEHFRIERYIRPYAASPTHLGKGETYMVFPFDHTSVPPMEAHTQIANRLTTLGARTLLFLHHLEELDYEADDGTIGCYARQSWEEESPRHVMIRGGTASQDSPELEEHWLLFEKEVNRSDTARSRPIQIAYRLESDGRGGPDHVVSTPDAPLAVSFPTDQRTDLGLLMDGPYITTSARDNIKRDDPWNCKLATETADLVVESLRWLRDAGLLSVGALQAMPIKSLASPQAYCAGFFRPIYDIVRQAFMQETLLPTNDGRHVNAKEAKLSRGSDIRTLLSGEQLKQLFKADHPISWLTSEITEERTPALREYLRMTLGVEEVTPAVFAARFDESFVQRQDDAWVTGFYAFLDGQKDIWRAPYWKGEAGGALRGKPFIRLKDDTHVAPFDVDGAPKAYLPSTTATQFPSVKESIARDPRALGFLRNLGLTEPELADEVLDFILPKYRATDSPRDWVWPRSISVEENLGDIRIVLLALASTQSSKKSRLEERVGETMFLCAQSFADEKLWFCLPRAAYLVTDDLLEYFDGDPQAHFLVHQFSGDEEAALCKLGASQQVRVSRREANVWSKHVTLQEQWGHHRRGLNGFDPDCEIDGLEHALNTITPNKSAYIWNSLLIPNWYQIRGTVESSSRQDYNGSTRQEQVSKFGVLVTSRDWIHGPNGEYHRPCDLTAEELPSEFERDERLVKTIGVRPPVEAEVLHALGLEADHARFIRDNPDLVRQWIEEQRRTATGQRLEDAKEDGAGADIDYEALLAEAFRRPQLRDQVNLPDNGGQVRNPDRYREHVVRDIERAKEEEPIAESRFLRVPRKVWEAKDSEVRGFLEAEYTGRCQICEATFSKRDGKPYFEGVYLVSRTEARWVDHPGNVLCLCATCAAKFEHGSVEAEDLVGQILALELRGEEGEQHLAIRIRLCGDEVAIRFSDRHILRLQALLT